MAEVGWAFIPSLPLTKAARGKSERVEENRDRAVRRARSRLRQLILTTKADHLLTLTYRGNVVDFDKACRDLARFVRLVKVRKPAWTYIAVPERQKRGAWHWHLAVQGRQAVGLLRATWRHIVGDGNIDVAAAKYGRQRGSFALVRYLGKYLAKGFADQRDLNTRRFRASLGIRVPTTIVTVPEDRRGDTMTFALEQLQNAAGRVGYVWQSNDLSAGWANSWE
jgi:hypothetical protein